MTLEIREDTWGQRHSVLTACPFCRGAIPEQVGFSQHWPRCPVNPRNGGPGV